MKMIVSGKNFEVTEALRNYAQNKIGKLDRHFDHEAEAKVKMFVEHGKHIVEATVYVDSMIIRAVEKNDDMYAAVDLVLEKLERQITKYKTKLYAKIKHKNLQTSVDFEEIEEEPEVKRPKLVKVKKFNFKPMNVEEAILQMELLGHNFFVFKEEETMETCVVYKRNDGQYGLIEEELD